MKRLLILVLLLVILFPGRARAQDDEPLCDTMAYLEKVQTDLEYYGEQMTEVDITDLAEVGLLYVELIDTRHRYEDIVVCAELEAVNRTVIVVFGAMSDATALTFFSVARPDAARLYRGIFDLMAERQSQAIDRMMEQFQAMIE